MADIGPRGPQGPAGTSIDLPVAVANGGTGATTAQAAANALQVASLGARVFITEGADLNSFTEVGSYACQTSTIAASLANCPASSAFILDVGFANGGGSYRSQTLRKYDTGTTYYRCYYVEQDTWGKWFEFAGVAVS